MLDSLSTDVDSTSVIASDTGQWFGRATTKVLSDNTVVMVYREGSSHASTDDVLHIRFSDDYGATWSAEDEDLDTNPVSLGYPTGTGPGDSLGVLESKLYLAPNGDLLLHCWSRNPNVTLNGTWQTRSTDGGLTWSAWAKIDFVGITGDDNIFATDDDFVYDGVIYASARKYTVVGGIPGSHILVSSDDNGATWDYISDIVSDSELTSGSEETGIEFLGNNTIIAMIRDKVNKGSYRRWSFDMGATWGDLQDVTTTVGIAGRQRVYTLDHLQGGASWWTDTTLIMVGFTRLSGAQLPRRNCVWVSLDAGEHWSKPMFIDSQCDDCGYGDVIWNPTSEQFVVVSNQGDTSECDVKQYNLTINNLP